MPARPEPPAEKAFRIRFGCRSEGPGGWAAGRGGCRPCRHPVCFRGIRYNRGDDFMPCRFALRSAVPAAAGVVSAPPLGAGFVPGMAKAAFRSTGMASSWGCPSPCGWVRHRLFPSRRARLVPTPRRYAPASRPAFREYARLLFSSIFGAKGNAGYFSCRISDFLSCTNA